MKLIGQIELDLEDIFTEDDFLADLIREELRKEVRGQLKEFFTTNVVFVGAMKKAMEKASAEIINVVTGWSKLQKLSKKEEEKKERDLVHKIEHLK